MKSKQLRAIQKQVKNVQQWKHFKMFYIANAGRVNKAIPLLWFSTKMWMPDHTLSGGQEQTDGFSKLLDYKQNQTSRETNPFRRKCLKSSSYESTISWECKKCGKQWWNKSKTLVACWPLGNKNILLKICGHASLSLDERNNFLRVQKNTEGFVNSTSNIAILAPRKSKHAGKSQLLEHTTTEWISPMWHLE